MIEQQYYTRERGGVFNQTDGYDTVAKSPQLKLEYIKKNLHPLCSYDIPSELQKSGEIDETKYPPRFILVPLESGETIVGQAVYKTKDFTGLRSAFFMHNLVFSETERRRYIKEPEKLFGISCFAESYDIKNGRELSTLAAIPYEVPELFKDRTELLKELHMSERQFYQLVAAAFIVSSSKKKIFIVLDVPVETLGKYSKALLYHLYAALPWSVAERLGVCTYSGNLEARKNIQITFLDQHTIRYDAKTTKEIIFDFPHQKFLNVDEKAEERTYNLLALKYIHNKTAWEKYNLLADDLGRGLGVSQHKDIHFYGRAALFFEMNLYLKANRAYPLRESSMRQGLMRELLSYCKVSLSEETQKEILGLMEYTIDLLHIPGSHTALWDEEETKALLEYKLKLCEGNRKQFEHCQQIILSLLNEGIKEQNDIYSSRLMKQCQQYPTFYKQLFEAVYKDGALRNKIIHRQLRESFESVQTIDQLIQQVSEWETVEETLFLDDYYKELVINQFLQAVGISQNKMALLNKVQHWCKGHPRSMYHEINSLCEQHFLQHIRIPQDIASEEDLCSLNFTGSYQEENYELIMTYKKIKTDISALSPRNLKLNVKVQELIKYYYQQAPSSKNFYMLVYAFLKPKQNGTLGVQLPKVLGYLAKINADLMFDFIIWSKGQEVYLDKEKFDSEVLSFFKRMRDKKKKFPKALIQKKLGNTQKTRGLAAKILYVQQPAIVRMLCDYKKQFIAASMLIVLAGGVTGTYLWHKDIEKKSNTQLLSHQAIEELRSHLVPPSQDTEVEKMVEKYFKDIPVSHQTSTENN